MAASHAATFFVLLSINRAELFTPGCAPWVPLEMAGSIMPRGYSVHRLGGTLLYGIGSPLGCFAGWWRLLFSLQVHCSPGSAASRARLALCRASKRAAPGCWPNPALLKCYATRAPAQRRRAPSQAVGRGRGDAAALSQPVPLQRCR